MEENNVNTAEQENAVGTKQTFDELLKDKDYQAEFDKRVSKAISTREANLKEELRKQWELEQNEKLTEAEKLASMTEKQKHEYELKKVLREKEEAEATLNAYKLKDQTLKMAEEKGLPSALVELLDFRRIKADEVETEINKILDVYKKAIENGINERLKEPTPTTKTTGTQTAKKEIPAII